MQAPAGGPPGERTQGRKGNDRSHKACPPPPSRGTGAAPRASAVLASCLRHACNEGQTTSPPPPTHTSAPPRVGGEGREGRTAPPPRRGQSGKVGRQRREGAGRTTRPCPKEARAVQAPAGGAPGVRTQGRKGDDGSHTASPPPLQRDKCRAWCLRRACDVLTPEDGQRGRLPPHALLPHPPRKGARTARRWREAMGGGQRTDRRARGRDGRQAVEAQQKQKKTNKNNEQSKPTRQGKKARRQGPKPRRTGEAGATWARKGRR